LFFDNAISLYYDFYKRLSKDCTLPFKNFITDRRFVAEKYNYYNMTITQRRESKLNLEHVD